MDSKESDGDSVFKNVVRSPDIPVAYREDASLVKLNLGIGIHRTEGNVQSVDIRVEGTPGDWSHISRQVGMFTLTGLSPEQVAFMTKEYHIYMSSDGRVNMAGPSSQTIPHLVDAIDAAVSRIA